MKEWNPQWEKQWSKSKADWDLLKKVYNSLYEHQDEYGLRYYEIESDEKKRHAWDKDGHGFIRRGCWSYCALGREIQKILLTLKTKKYIVEQFFQKYFIITDEEEIKRLDKFYFHYNDILLKKKETEEQRIIKEKKAQRISGTIYGIFIANRLVYIGKTTREPEERWKEHLKYAENPELESSQQEYLYRAMRLYQGQVEFKILKRNTFANNYELEKLEKLLIENLKPDYNYEGVIVPYKFSKDKGKKE